MNSIQFLRQFFLIEPQTEDRAKIVALEGSEVHPGKFAIITQTRQQKKEKIATRHLIESEEIEFDLKALVDIQRAS